MEIQPTQFNPPNFLANIITVILSVLAADVLISTESAEEIAKIPFGGSYVDAVQAAYALALNDAEMASASIGALDGDTKGRIYRVVEVLDVKHPKVWRAWVEFYAYHSNGSTWLVGCSAQAYGPSCELLGHRADQWHRVVRAYQTARNEAFESVDFDANMRAMHAKLECARFAQREEKECLNEVERYDRNTAGIFGTAKSAQVDFWLSEWRRVVQECGSGKDPCPDPSNWPCMPEVMPEVEE